jgi:hypothetical protein
MLALSLGDEMRRRILYSGVQQPCSNPGEYPETLRKGSRQEYALLQEFCKLWNTLANYHAAFTRQRSLVRAQHRPL